MLVGYNPRIIYDLFKDVACCVCELLVLIFDRYSNKSTLLLEIADLLQLGVTFVLSIHTPWKHVEGVEVQIHWFISSALD